MATLQNLHVHGAGITAEWSSYYGLDELDATVDLTGVRLKNITLTVEDNGTLQKVTSKIAALEKDLADESLSHMEKAFTHAQLDVLREVSK
jgi:hypothetical protein